MLLRGKIASLTFVVLFTAVHIADAATMTFDGLPIGTVFGAAAGDAPHDLVYQEDGIRMSVDYLSVKGTQGFLEAEVGGRYNSFFASNPLDLNNISVRLDVQNVGFDVNSLSLDFVELGPLNNFAVNGGTVYELASLQLLPTAVAPGVTASVAGGSIHLTGPIHDVLIGGQELGIDTIIAIPEPATLLLLSLGTVAMLNRRARSARRLQRRKG